MIKKLAVLSLFLIIISSSVPSVVNTAQAQGSQSWHFSWSCINSDCTSVMPSSSGSEGPYSSRSSCNSARSSMAGSNGINVRSCRSSGGSTGSYSSSGSISPSAIFANEMATAIISGFLIGLLSGPSPAQIEQERRAAFEAQRHQIEKQQRIETEKLQVQQKLFSQLIPVGGLSATLSNTTNGNNTGNDNLMNTLVNFDKSSKLTGGSTLDTLQNSNKQGLDAVLVDLTSINYETAAPAIPGVYPPVDAGLSREDSMLRKISSLPASLFEDPDYDRLNNDISDLYEIEERYQSQKADMERKLASGELGLEEWRQFQSNYQQDMNDLVNKINNSERELQALLQQHGVDPTDYKALEVAEYFNSTQRLSSPVNSTLLAFDTPQYNSHPNSPGISRSDIEHQQAIVDLLNDPDYLEARSNAYTLKYLDEGLDARRESKNILLRNKEISQKEWDDFNILYLHDKEKFKAAIDSNLNLMDSVYERNNAIKSEQLKELYYK